MDAHVGEAVRRAFDLPSGTLTPEPVARGQLGVVHRYDALDGSRWAVKQVIASPSEGEVAPAAQFEDAALRHGVPVPAVRRTVSGAVLAKVGSRTFRVSSWVDLKPADIDLDAATVGALLATLHAVPTDLPTSAGVRAVDPWYVEPVGAAVWDTLISRCLVRKAPLAERLAAHRDELVALEGLLSFSTSLTSSTSSTSLTSPSSLRTCHRDLFADNVRGTGQGGICVIDFDSSGPADPSQELAFVLVEFATDATGAMDQIRGQTLLDAYAAAGGPGRLTGPGSFSMVVAVLGHLAELGVRRWLAATDPGEPADPCYPGDPADPGDPGDPGDQSDPGDPGDRDAAAAIVGLLLDRPLTRDVIDGLLTLR